MAEREAVEAEESLFDRIWNRITNKQKEVTPKNKAEMKLLLLQLFQSTVLFIRMPDKIKSDQDINTGIDFTPLKIKGLASMVETNDIFCTPSENFLHISPATITKNTFKLEESKRSVAVLGDWSEGLGFGINQAVWTNIQPTPPVIP